MQHFKKAHQNMIFGQFLPNKLTGARLLHAFEEVWREGFVPEASKPLSYSDQFLTLSPARALMSPLSFMRLLKAAEVTSTDHILHVGAGTGYGSVILSYLSQKVIVLEEEGAFYAQLAQNVENSSAKNIELVQGQLADGCSPKGPYDLIFVEGVAEEIPNSLLEQLKNNGRLLVFEPLAGLQCGKMARACQFQKIKNTYTKTYLFEAVAPLLPSFSKTTSFQL